MIKINSTSWRLVEAEVRIEHSMISLQCSIFNGQSGKKEAPVGQKRTRYESYVHTVCRYDLGGAIPCNASPQALKPPSTSAISTISTHLHQHPRSSVSEH